MNLIRRAVRRVVGFQPVYEPEFLGIWARCQPYTMTGIERGYGLWVACRYLIESGRHGDFIECGVYRGGSAMLMALTLAAMGEHRDIYLYDTFAGMPEPGANDLSPYEPPAHSIWKKKPEGWCVATVDEVRENMASTGYAMDRIHLVPGMVEDTLPSSKHERIAMLRLDTDWYQSTLCELEILYPRIVPGGVLLIDDYGHWRGSAKAVNEYFKGSLLFSPLDYSGRIAVKPVL